MDEVQRVILHERGIGKFIQLYVNFGTEEVPVFASKQKPCFHAQILSSTLDKLGIEYNFEIYKLTRESNETIKVPEKNGKNYRLVRAGKLEFIPGNTILFINNIIGSEGYKIGFSKEHFEQIRKHFPAGLEVKLEYD